MKNCINALALLYYQVAGKLEKPRPKASKFDLDHHFVDQIGNYCRLSLLLPKCDYISINTFLWLMHKIFKLLIFKMQECLICFALCVAQCAKRDTSKCAFPLPSSIQIKKKKNPTSSNQPSKENSPVLPILNPNLMTHVMYPWMIHNFI